MSMKAAEGNAAGAQRLDLTPEGTDQAKRQREFFARHPEVHFRHYLETPGERVALSHGADGACEARAPDLETLLDKV